MRRLSSRPARDRRSPTRGAGLHVGTLGCLRTTLDDLLVRNQLGLLDGHDGDAADLVCATVLVVELRHLDLEGTEDSGSVSGYTSLPSVVARLTSIRLIGRPS